MAGSVTFILLYLLSLTTFEENQDTSVLSSQSSEEVASTRETATVSRVIDGDTIELTTGEKVRYIGMDTPELRPNECYGKEATERNKKLVENKKVEMEKDISKTDRYGRLLRYVYLEDKMINRILVQEGYARVATYPPDVKYQKIFLEDERKAREAEKGLWGKICEEV